jgi:hypothetical protein
MAYAVAIRRPSSPLTNLSDEDDQTAELKETLNQAIENMKRELALIRNSISGKKNQDLRLPVILLCKFFLRKQIIWLMVIPPVTSAKYLLELPRYLSSMQRP